MAGRILEVPGPTTEELEASQAGRNPYVLDTLDHRGKDPVVMEGVRGTVERIPALEREQGQSWFGIGEEEAYTMQMISGFNDMVAGAGDAVLNAIIDSYTPLREDADRKGLDEPTRSQFPQLSRDYLQRFVNRGDYESVQYIFPKLAKWFSENVPDLPEGSAGESIGNAIAAFNKYGAGEKIGIPDNWQSRLFRTAGQMGAVTVPFAGVTARAAQFSTSGYRAAQEMLLRQRLAQSPRLDAGKHTLTGGLEIMSQATTAPYVSFPTGAPLLEGLYGVLSGGGMEAEHEVFGTHTGIGGIAPLALPATLMWVGRNSMLGRLYNRAEQRIKEGGSWTREGGLEKAQKELLETGQDPAKVVAARDEKTVEVRNEVVAKIQEEMSTPEAQKAIERAKQLELELDPYADSPIGFSPGEASMVPGLVMAQTHSEVTTPVGSPFFKRNAERRANIISAAKRFQEGKLASNVENLPDTPAVIFEVAKKRYETTLGLIDKAEGGVDDQLSLLASSDEGAGALLPQIKDVDRDVGGAAIRAKIKAAREAVLVKADKLAKKLNINEADQVIAADKFLEAQAKVRNFLPRDAEGSLSYPNMHKVFKAFVEHKNPALSFQDWKAFRGQVGDAISSAIANQRGSDIRDLTRLREVMDEMAETGAFAATAKKFHEFGNWYKLHYIEPYEPVMHILTPRAHGGSSYIIPDESVAKAFFQSAEGGRAYRNLYGDDPTMMGHMKAAALDSARDAAVRPRGDGLIDPTKLQTWITKNGSTLRELGFLPEFQQSQKIVQDLSTRAQDLAGRRKAIVQSDLYRKISAIDDGGSRGTKNPDKLISEIFAGDGNVRLAETLRKLAEREATKSGDDTYLQAWNATIIDKIFKTQPNWMDNPANFKTYLDKHARVLDASLTKEHVDNIYILADAYERALITGSSQKGKMDVETFLSKFESTFGFSTANLSNRALAWSEGRIGPRAVGAYLLSRAINARSMRRANALWEAAVLDRNLAKTLVSDIPASLPSGSITPKTRDYIHMYLYNLGVPFGEEFYTNPGEGEDFPVLFEPNNPPPPPANITVRPAPSSPPQTVPGPQTEATTPTPAPVQVASSPAPPVNVESVFPFDADLQAIENRRNAASNQGLASLA